MPGKRSGPGTIRSVIRSVLAKRRQRPAARSKSEAWRPDEVFRDEQRRRPSFRYMV